MDRKPGWWPLLKRGGFVEKDMHSESGIKKRTSPADLAEYPLGVRLPPAGKMQAVSGGIKVCFSNPAQPPAEGGCCRRSCAAL